MVTCWRKLISDLHGAFDLHVAAPCTPAYLPAYLPACPAAPCTAGTRILVDDWGFNDVGFHNQANENIIRTPNMDRLSASPHGIRLERFCASTTLNL